jgi:hypothetical protein
MSSAQHHQADSLRRSRVPLIVRAIIVAVLLATGLGFPKAAVAGATPVHFQASFPLSFETANECNGEILLVTGVDREVITSVSTPSGGQHLHLASIFFGTAQGSFGDTYRYNEHSSDSLERPSSGVTLATDAFSGLLISENGSPNYSVSGVFHRTVTADSQVTAFVDQVRVTCNG